MERTYKPKVVRKPELTELSVPHYKGERVFAYPPISTNSMDRYNILPYRALGAEILRRGQRVPTGDDMASFYHVLYNCDDADEPELENLRHPNTAFIRPPLPISRAFLMEAEVDYSPLFGSTT